MMSQRWTNPKLTMMTLQIPRVSPGCQAAMANIGAGFTHAHAMLDSIVSMRTKLQDPRVVIRLCERRIQCQQPPLLTCRLLQKAVQTAVRVAPAAAA